MSINRECAVRASPAPGEDLVICKQISEIELNNLHNEKETNMFYLKEMLPEIAAVCFHPQDTWDTVDSKKGPSTLTGECETYVELKILKQEYRYSARTLFSDLNSYGGTS